MEHNNHLAEYQENIKQLTVLQEGYLAFIEPIIENLKNLPDNVTIASIRKNSEQEVEAVLNAAEDASMAGLLMDYPALYFSIGPSGSMREPDVKNPNEPVYSGVLIEKKKGLVYWQSNVGCDVINFTCQTNAVVLNAWNNPAHTGPSVATVRINDCEGTTPWASFSQSGSDYWVQPVNAVGLLLLSDAVHWKQTRALSISLRDDFNDRIKSVSTLAAPQAKIILNALFSWATTDNALPTKRDFSAWTASRGNVLVMHGIQDWLALTASVKQGDAQTSAVQLKIKLLSERLPNIWRFVDEADLGIVCDAMQSIQARWVEHKVEAVSGLTL